METTRRPIEDLSILLKKWRDEAANMQLVCHFKLCYDQGCPKCHGTGVTDEGDELCIKVLVSNQPRRATP